LLKPRFAAGGELPFDPGALLKRRLGQYSNYGNAHPEYHKYYTFGGYFSLMAIIKDLAVKADETILLPSYLCPTIIDAVKACGCQYAFYQLKPGLIPDQESILARLTPDVRAVLYIDHFGFPSAISRNDADMIPIRRRAVIIQDTVQAWVSDKHPLYGDYCFNSVRKYTPYEGSVILAKKPMSFAVSGEKTLQHALTKRLAQFIRHCYLNYGVFTEEMFLKLIERSHASYHQDQISKDLPLNHYLLDRFDFISAGRRRKRIYDSLKQSLDLEEIVQHPEPSDSIPLGLAIRINDRDRIRKELAARGVFCPIHWKLSDEIDKDEFSYSWEVSSSELTLPLSVDLQYLDRYIQILREVIK